MSTWGCRADTAAKLLREAQYCAARPELPSIPRDALEKRILQAEVKHPGIRTIIERRMVRFPEGVWSHPELCKIVEPYVRYDLLRQLYKGRHSKLIDGRMALRCETNVRRIADWLRMCTQLELGLFDLSNEATEEQEGPMMAENILVTYHIHVERLVAIVPEHAELLRRVLLNNDVVEKVCLILQTKTDMAGADGEYHNSLLGFPIPALDNPSFGVFEVGCARSLDDFRKYWVRLGFDSYEDYLRGILYNDGKGFDLYEQLTDEKVPDDLSEEIVGRFFCAHIIKVLQPDLLLAGLFWICPSKPLRVLPDELL